MSALPIIGSLGAGRMGRGIAHAFAYAGHEVVLIDGKPREAEAEELGEIIARIRFAPYAEAPRALAEVDVLFEGVPEVLEAKRAAFALAGAHLRADAISTGMPSIPLPIVESCLRVSSRCCGTWGSRPSRARRSQPWRASET